jgi:hypothetical protein
MLHDKFCAFRLRVSDSKSSAASQHALCELRQRRRDRKASSLPLAHAIREDAGSISHARMARRRTRQYLPGRLLINGMEILRLFRVYIG